jgi:putative membrane protein
MPGGPRFLGEDGAPEAAADVAAKVVPPPGNAAPPPDEALPRGPVLLDPEQGAPRHLDIGWAPEIVAPPRPLGATVLWISGGIGVLLATWIGLSLTRFLLALFQSSGVLGMVGAIATALGLAMIGYGAAREWRAYRSLAATERFRVVLAGDDAALEAVRSVGLDWTRRVAPEMVTDRTTLDAGLRAAASLMEIRMLLRSRLAVRLREASLGIGRRAALEGATLVAICPHPALDALAVSLRGVVMIRQIAALHGVRPGLAVTISLLRRIATTAAGTSGAAFLSQTLADHLLTTTPGVKHVAAAIPGAGTAAFRLYRLAGITATACCPVSTS